MEHKKDWFKELVVYQIYPRSFRDSNGDGIGDLKGMTEKLHYLQWLGINAVWLSPVYASPNVDNGYDISDYRAIMEEFGTMEDWEEFRNKAHELGIAVIMDLVLNHTSDQHKWFLESKRSKDNPYSNYYIWRDPGPDGKEPNHWQSVFGGSAWEYVPERGQYYLHFFAKQQPDLNWEADSAREDILDIIRFWNGKGVDGYRIDAISYLDKGLDGRADMSRKYGPEACANLEGTHRYIREMVEKTMAKEHLMTVGEVIANQPGDVWNYTSALRREFDMAIPFVAPEVEINTWSPEGIKRNLQETYEALKKDGWWARFLSNHDKPRQVSLYGDDKRYWNQSAKMLGAFIHTLPGTPFIYQGEEIGMTNHCLDSIEQYQDIDTKNYYEGLLKEGDTPEEALKKARNISRDNARTPMQWDDSGQGGFTSGTPWLTVNPNTCFINVEAQKGAEDSILNFYRRLIKLRKENPVLISGDFCLVSPVQGPVIAYTRTYLKTRWLIVHNFMGEEQEFTCKGAGSKTVLLSNWKRKEISEPDLYLKPYETLIVELSE